MRSARENEGGFALVEVVIAAAILAGMMALTYRTIAANASSARLVAERREAAMLAQSVLAQATASSDAAARVIQGRDAALAWQVTRAPYPSTGAALERVAVRITDASGTVLTLQTLRLAR